MNTAHGILAAVILGALTLYAYTTLRYGHALAVADAHLYYAHAHSWYFDGDADYENNLQANPDLEVRDFYLAQRANDGQVLDIFPCGWSIVALPFVAVADATTALYNAMARADVPRDGFSVFYRAIIPLGHVLVGLAGVLASFAVTARFFDRTTAAVATALVWVGTNAVYFISIEPTMSHSASLGFVCLMIWMAESIHRFGWTFRRAVSLGLFCGMMMAVRHQNIVWLVVPLALLVPSLISPATSPRESWRRRSALAATAIVVAAFCLMPQACVNLTTHGSLAGGLSKYSPDWAHPQFVRDLFDWPTGLIVLYPLTGICLIGVVLWVWLRGFGPFPRALMLGCTALLYINACGGAGASRRYACGFAVLCLGMATLVEWAKPRSWRTLIVAVPTALACAGNITLMWLVDHGELSRYIFTAAPLGAIDVMQALGRLVPTP